MYCEKCGKEIKDNIKHCPNCGAVNETNAILSGSEKTKASESVEKIRYDIDFIKQKILRNVKSDKPSILANLIVLAIALTFIGIAIDRFMLAHETLYTYNGISKSEAVGQLFFAWFFLISGYALAIGDIVNWYNKSK